MKYGREQQAQNAIKTPTILAYQPQINFYYPNTMVNGADSPISQINESILSKRRHDTFVTSQSQQVLVDAVDYRVEIEKKFRQSKVNQMYEFPRTKINKSDNGSFESLKNVGFYDLKQQNVHSSSQNQKQQQPPISHLRTKTDNVGILKKTEYQVPLPYVGQSNSRGTSASKSGQRIRTEGNQAEETISITQLRAQNKKLVQNLKDLTQIRPIKVDKKRQDTYRLMFGLPAQTDRSTSRGKKNEKTSNKPSSQSPMLQQTNRNLGIYGINTQRGTGGLTDRKGYTHTINFNNINHKERIRTLPTEKEDSPRYDLAKQMEKFRLNQQELLSYANINKIQIPLQKTIKLEKTSLSPQSKNLYYNNKLAAKHQRTQTANYEKQTLRLKTEPQDFEYFHPSSKNNKNAQQGNYFQKKLNR